MERVGLDFKPLIRALRQIERVHNIIVATDPSNLSEADNQTRQQELELHARIHAQIERVLGDG